MTFAVGSVPDAWLEALPEGGRLVAPVGPEEGQRLLAVERRSGELVWADHGPVRYVANRSLGLRERGERGEREHAAQRKPPAFP